MRSQSAETDSGVLAVRGGNSNGSALLALNDDECYDCPGSGPGDRGESEQL